MRVLFATLNDGSFLHPMISLAWALRTAGHEVCVANQAFATPHVVGAGLTSVPVGRQTTSDRLLTAFRVTPEMLEDARPGLHPPYDVAGDPSLATLEYMVSAYAEDVERSKYENFPMINGLVSFARSWQPDLVVWEPFTLAGAIAAKACGAAHARMMFGIDAFGVARQRFLALQPDEDPLAAWLGSYARKYGGSFTEDMTCGHFTIDQYPPSLQLEAPGLEYLHTRYIPYGGKASIPAWLQKPAERPRVALTMGFTASGFFNGFGFSLQSVLDNLAGLDIEVIAVADKNERAKLTHIPANTRIESWVPLDALAATCSVAVNHAGGGTLSTFAIHGVPQLTLPYHFDEPILGRNLTATGAGLTINPADATGENVRNAIQALLTDPAFTTNAHNLRTEMRVLPTPNHIVPRLEELALKYRS
ncbi:nucleotide disphospho-sugar-binding domain-containing protein [Actinocrispum sp. NPDC049592]|uniref:nucleotide disphospho-sugar-binding domain-containing protein n=1 Tax=Actinocrispum sp. NPDC049592 TaxID=3154835 RepID=UPI00341F1975